MNLLDIQTAFSGLLNRRDATPAQQASWLTMGIAKIQRELRCPAMEKTVVLTIDGSYSNGIIIPNDFIELQYLQNSQGKRITKEDITTVAQLAGGTSSTVPVLIDFPRFYVRTGGKWLLGPTPSVGDTITMVYYAELVPLVNPTDTTTLSKIAGDIYVYAALCYAGDFFTDKRSPKWESRYSEIASKLQIMADDDELSGGATVSPAYHYPSDDYEGGSVVNYYS